MIDRASSEALSSRLQDARDDAYAAVEASLSSTRARSLMIDAAEWISIGDWRTQADETLYEQPSTDFASGVFDKLWKKVAKGGDNAILAAAGYNFFLLLRWLKGFLSLLIALLQPRPKPVAA
ncbi:hypothetical protein AU467_30030 [Mesorhizobium loti]|uniref:CHAD domain-containing protein n=1 Tax=Rhizobium loti TaxID=381 RepID=A0A117N2D9_RHILI|nr:hypothetical protein AU467_30030 [Mesorhizobium loti]